MPEKTANQKLREHLDSRLKGLETERYSWWVHWRELADFILPRRMRWLVTPNQWNKGAPLNSHIIDSTGTIAARTLAAGMMAGITSPTRPWFKLSIHGFGNDESHPVSVWLAECESRIRRVFQESNFYNSIATVWADLAVFGTAPMTIDEDDEDVIRCYNMTCGEYFLANGPRLKIEVAYRKFPMSVSQIVKRWGIERCSENVKSSYRTGGASLSLEVMIGHAIEPNDDLGVIRRSAMPYRQCYWELGSDTTLLLEERGYHEWPGIAPRWDITSNDAYGRSPAMDALSDIKQLQQEQRRKAQAIDKMVNPPMVADVQLKNQPASLLPGGVTYVAGMLSRTGRGAGAAFAPAYEVRPNIREMMEDIQEVQRRIQNIFYNDLFMMFQQLQAEPRSAAAVDARREEKLVMLGPVLERVENEALDPAIERTWGIMTRSGLLPPAPPEIQGMPIKVNYVSMLAEAQRAASSAGLERTLALAGNLAAAQQAAGQPPDVLDGIDLDEALAEFGNLMAVAPKILRDRGMVAAMRQQRAQAQAQERMAALTAQAAQSAKTLSETDVGGGNNALQLMTGLGR